MRIVDLRGDTLTLPTDEMLDAIKKAKLGDDTWREDPTVNRLEEIAANKMGKEAALLVTSGTQGNLTSILTHTRHGDEVIMEADAHTYHWEVAGISRLGGLQSRLVKGEYGVMDIEDVEAAIRSKPVDIHQPPTTLICMENTHNHSGGAVLRPEDMKPIYDLAKSENIAVHTDGARVFNASVALDIDVRELTKYTDSIMFCLSKGLSCPVGSIIAGESEFIEKARKIRKMLGGGMRQAGIIAAPGIIALEKMIDRLRDDHENAKFLAQGLSQIEGIKVDVNRVQTNLVMFDVGGLGVDSSEFVGRLTKEGIKALSFGGNKVRVATYRGIEKNDLEYALDVMKRLFVH
jgi:threonine aldolase